MSERQQQQQQQQPPPHDGPVLILSQDDECHVYARTNHGHPDMSTALQNFLVSTCEPVTRPHFFNQYKMTAVSLCAAASERVFSPLVIAQVLLRYSGLPRLPAAFQRLLRNMEMERRLQLILEPVDELAVRGDQDALFAASMTVPQASTAPPVVKAVRRMRDVNKNNAGSGISGAIAPPAPPMMEDLQTQLKRRRDAARTTRLAYVLTGGDQE
jgi:hypothetical protein